MTKVQAEDAMINHWEVESGEGDDRDCGIISQIRGDHAFVHWQSGVNTWIAIVDLEPAVAPWL